ncbi:hypothetical protein ABES25_00040 [Bacillus gobiensis]|uniref:hypothetical protein n=1 Tax=Bacillus gobiensis TaxID=1441095 RepID=UPI003D1FF597
MKKFKMIVAALIVALLVPSSTFAGSVEPFDTGEWDYQGKDVFTDQSKNFKSGGGAFKICLSSDSKPGYYQLYEEDPYNPDDEVKNNDGTVGLYFKTAGSKDFDSKNCHVWKDVNGYVDGDQAEFYLAKYSGGNSTVYAWD